jgi:hypothetical protein
MHKQDSRVGLLLLAVLLVAAACSVTSHIGATVSPSAPTGADTHQPRSPDRRPAGFEISVQDPDMHLLLPVGWRDWTVNDMRAELDRAEAGDMPAETSAQIRAHFDAGRMRAGALGDTDAGVQTRFTIMVIDDLATLDDGVTWAVEYAELVEDVASQKVEPMDLAIDVEIVRVYLLSGPDLEPPLVPSQSIYYVIRLDDGRTVVLGSRSIESDESFRSMMERIISTLRLE